MVCDEKQPEWKCHACPTGQMSGCWPGNYCATSMPEWPALMNQIYWVSLLMPCLSMGCAFFALLFRHQNLLCILIAGILPRNDTESWAMVFNCNHFFKQRLWTPVLLPVLTSDAVGILRVIGHSQLRQTDFIQARNVCLSWLIISAMQIISLPLFFSLLNSNSAANLWYRTGCQSGVA